MSKARAFAAHTVAWGTEVLEPGVVEVAGDGAVTAAYRLLGEQPSTVWLGGRVEVLADGEGIPRAYHNGKPIQ